MTVQSRQYLKPSMGFLSVRARMRSWQASSAMPRRTASALTWEGSEGGGCEWVVESARAG